MNAPVMHADPRSVAYLSVEGNAGWPLLNEAQVPVLDRGFVFGDGVYEVVPVYNGAPFRWPEHRARMVRSLESLRIADPYDDAAWLEIVGRLAARNAALGTDLMVYLQVTRGIAKRDHPFPASSTPTVFGMANAWAAPAAAMIETGLSAITLDDIRWLRCDIKSISLLGNVLARQAAVDAGANEAIMIRDGLLTEGSSSNVWLVKSDQLFSPPPDRRLLAGIRIGLLGELAAAAKIPFEARPVERSELFNCDELMISGAGREVMPVTKLDGKPVGDGKPGPVFRALYAGYQAAKARNAHKDAA
ncbi:D-amino acid aminotransferase [soil metagenome]